MKISIITPSFNQSPFIEKTILSVLNQNYSDFEHIIIDGGSTDGTIGILKKYPHLNWVSEKDNGQSHAVNKGFRRAKGEIIAWINSDDYYEPNVFGPIARFFESHPHCKFLYGDITYVDINGKRLGTFSGGGLSFRRLLSNPDVVRQPSSFWKRDVLEDIGNLNESLHMTMDFDFFLRISIKHDLHYINKTLSNFRYHASGKTSNFLKTQAQEFKLILGRHVKFPSLLVRWILLRRTYYSFLGKIRRGYGK